MRILQNKAIHMAAKPTGKRKPSGTKKQVPLQEVIGKLTNEDLQPLVEMACLLAFYAYDYGLIAPSKATKVAPFVHAAEPIMSRLRLPVQYVLDALKEIEQDNQMEDSDEGYETFMKSLLIVIKDMRRMSHLSPTLIDLLDNARLASNGSDGGFNFVKKNIGLLKNRNLLDIVSKKTGVATQKQDMPALEALVKKLGGKGYDLTLDQAKKAREKDAETYKEYLALHRKLREKAGDYVREWVRANSDDSGLADYEALQKAMKQDDITVHKLPQGFVGKIDDIGQLYTTAGKLIKGVPGGGKVVMNPKYDPKQDNAYVFQAIIPGAVTQTRYYTVDYKSAGIKKKFERVGNLSAEIKVMRDKWRAKLKLGGTDPYDPTFLSAMVLEICYQTQSRIGAVGNASMDKDGKYKTTFGMSTILCKHLRPKGTGVSINFPGKKGVKQSYFLDPSVHPAVRKCVRFLLKWKAERGPNDPVFENKRGNPIGPAEVNRLFKAIGAPDGVTIHKLRHLKGTAMMAEIIDKNPWVAPDKNARSTSEVNKWLQTKAIAIGKQLGHMSNGKVIGTTAIQNYCNPQSMIKLYKDASVIPPKTMLSLVGVDPKSLQGFDFEGN